MSAALGLAVKAQEQAGVANGKIAKVPLAQKLSELARTSAARNPDLQPPWLLPDNWVAGAEIRAGNVVLANGYWWVARNGTAGAPAICAATGTGPSTPTTGNYVVDGTVEWLALMAPTATANDPRAPTITRSNTAPAAPNNVAWSLVSTPGKIAPRFYGGYQDPAVTDRYRMVTANRSATDLKISAGGTIGFWSAAAIVTIASPQTNGIECPFRVSVAGRYVTPSGFTSGPAGTVYTKIDWSNVGGAFPRYYEIHATSRSGTIMSINAIYTSAGDLIWAPDTSDDVRVYWISDSQSAGHGVGPYAPGGGIPFRVGRHLGWNDVWNASIGGTGYKNAGAGPYYTFRQRIAEGVTRNPDAWVLYGSTNDGTYTAAEVQAEVLGSCQDIRASGSKAPIFVIGVEPVNAGTAALENAIKAAVVAFNDPMAFFIPLSTLAVPPVIGSYNRPDTVPAAVSNISIDVFTGDGTHLMERTMAKRAAQISEGIKATYARLLG